MDGSKPGRYITYVCMYNYIIVLYIYIYNYIDVHIYTRAPCMYSTTFHVYEIFRHACTLVLSLSLYVAYCSMTIYTYIHSIDVFMHICSCMSLLHRSRYSRTDGFPSFLFPQ